MNQESPHGCVHETNNTQMVWLIGNLLRIGVIASLSLVTLGIVLTFVQHPEYVRSGEALHQLTNSGRGALPHSMAELRACATQSTGRAVILAGLLVLIAAPVARVAVSTALFVRQRDWTYAAITGAVLVLLVVSFVIGMVK